MLKTHLGMKGTSKKYELIKLCLSERHKAEKCLQFFIKKIIQIRTAERVKKGIQEN
jgi:hypothetical protein